MLYVRNMESYFEEDVQSADQNHVPCNSKVRISNQNFKKQNHNILFQPTVLRNIK